MNSLGKKSTAYVSYLLMNFFWYIILAITIVLGCILTAVFIDPSFIDFQASVPIDASLVQMEEITYSFMKIQEVKANIALGYISKNYPGLYIIFTLFVTIMLALTLFAFYQLRMVLKSSVYDAVFVQENIKRLKIMASLVIALDPIIWLYHLIFVKRLGSYIAKHSIDVDIVSFNVGFILSGILLFALSTVFEKGYHMYQELKLTV